MNAALTSKGFFVWITVSPKNDHKHFADLDRIVRGTEAWLNSLDPDKIGPGEFPAKTFDDKAADVRIRAIPKKLEARTYRSEQIVGNPSPMLVGWS